MTIELIPLRCPDCSAPIHAQSASVLYYCKECGSGFETADDDSLAKVPVYFAQCNKDNVQFQPFWVFDATLDLRKRDSNKSLMQHLKQQKGLSILFEERHTIRFYVPAFPWDLERREPVSLSLTYQQPELEYIARQPEFPPMMFSSKDAKQVADFLFLTSEIEQPDMLRELEYTLILTNPFALSLIV